MDFFIVIMVYLLDFDPLHFEHKTCKLDSTYELCGLREDLASIKIISETFKRGFAKITFYFLHTNHLCRLCLVQLP